MLATVEPIVPTNGKRPFWGELLCREEGFADWTDANWRDWYAVLPSILDQHLQYAYLSINVDSRHVLDQSIFQMLWSLSKRPSSAPIVLIEWTERDDGHVSDGELKRVGQRLEGLRQAGLMVVLDDVGSGIDGLARMSYVHPDYVKLDGRLLHESRKNLWLRQMLCGHVRMYTEMGMPVVAEWVETPQDLQIVREIGAQFGQGYLWTFAGVAVCDENSYV